MTPKNEADFYKQLEDAVRSAVSSSQKNARAVSADIAEFVNKLKPQIAQNLETALRLNEATHWQTLKIQAARVLQKTLQDLDDLGSTQRAQIKATVLTFIQVMGTVAVSA